MESPSSFNTANNRSRSSSEADIHTAQYQHYVVPEHHLDSHTATPTIEGDMASPTSPSSMYSDYGKMTPGADTFPEGVQTPEGVGLGFAGIPRSGLPYDSSHYEAEVQAAKGHYEREVPGAFPNIDAEEYNQAAEYPVLSKKVLSDTKGSDAKSSDIDASYSAASAATLSDKAILSGSDNSSSYNTANYNDATREVSDANASLDATHASNNATREVDDAAAATHNTGSVGDTSVGIGAATVASAYAASVGTATPSAANAASGTRDIAAAGHYSPAAIDSDIDHHSPVASPAAMPPYESPVASPLPPVAASPVAAPVSAPPVPSAPVSAPPVPPVAASTLPPVAAAVAASPVSAPPVPSAASASPARVSRFSFSDRSPSKPDVSGHYRSHSQTGTSPNKAATRKLHKSKVSQTSIESFSLPKEEAREGREGTPGDKKLGEYDRGCCGAVASERRKGWDRNGSY